MIVCFDYDKTISDIRMQSLCKKFRKENNEVWVVTMRKDNDYNRNIMKPVMDKLFLSFSNVIFCNEKPKLEMIQMLNADIYIDNISDEFSDISNHTNTIPLLWLSL
ncbi:MAG TPA: hypothetical protein VIM07_00850 [Chitinophagaceae bacterium]